MSKNSSETAVKNGRFRGQLENLACKAPNGQIPREATSLAATRRAKAARRKKPCASEGVAGLRALAGEPGKGRGWRRSVASPQSESGRYTDKGPSGLTNKEALAGKPCQGRGAKPTTFLARELTSLGRTSRKCCAGARWRYALDSLGLRRQSSLFFPPRSRTAHTRTRPRRRRRRSPRRGQTPRRREIQEPRWTRGATRAIARPSRPRRLTQTSCGRRNRGLFLARRRAPRTRRQGRTSKRGPVRATAQVEWELTLAPRAVGGKYVTSEARRGNSRRANRCAAGQDGGRARPPRDPAPRGGRVGPLERARGRDGQLF